MKKIIITSIIALIIPSCVLFTGYGQDPKIGWRNSSKYKAQEIVAFLGNFVERKNVSPNNFKVLRKDFNENKYNYVLNDKQDEEKTIFVEKLEEDIKNNKLPSNFKPYSVYYYIEENKNKITIKAYPTNENGFFYKKYIKILGFIDYPSEVFFFSEEIYIK